MILWRISNYTALDGMGGFHVSGRWHSKGRPIVYCTQNPATALLETLVHLEVDIEDQPKYFHVLKIEGPDAASRETIQRNDVPVGWEGDLAFTQSIGDRWLSEQRSLLLDVPSILVPETWNVLLNPMHPQANSLTIVAVYEHAFDARFF